MLLSLLRHAPRPIRRWYAKRLVRAAMIGVVLRAGNPLPQALVIKTLAAKLSLYTLLLRISEQDLLTIYNQVAKSMGLREAPPPVTEKRVTPSIPQNA